VANKEKYSIKMKQEEIDEEKLWDLDADELYDYYMKKAKQMLKKEKQVIMNAVNDLFNKKEK